MSLWENVLGGDIPSSSKLKNNDLTPDAYKGLRDEAAAMFNNATSGAAPINLSGIPTSGNNYTAQLTANEQSILDTLMQRIATPSQCVQDANSYVANTLAGKYRNPSTNPALAATIGTAQAPSTNTWMQTIAPILQKTYTPTNGAVASPFDTAMSTDNTRYGQSLDAVANNILSQNYQDERQRQRAATKTAQTADTNSFNQLVGPLKQEAVPRLIEQYGIDQGVVEFNARRDASTQLVNISVCASQGAIANMQPGQGFYNTSLNTYNAALGVAVQAYNA